MYQFLKKLKIGLSCGPTISLLSTHPKESKAGSQRGVCTLMFIAAVFTVTKKWKKTYLPMKQNEVHTCNGILLNLRKKEHSDTCYNTDKP